MAKPLVVSEADWADIRLASIRGVSDTQLALQYGIKAGTISSRRYNDRSWSIAKSNGALATKNDKGQLSTSLIDNLETIATSNPLLLAQYAHKKLKSAISKDALPDIESWSDMKTASEILRKACGLDKEQAQVSVNFWAGESSETPLIETESHEIPDSENPECSTDDWI